MGSYINPGNEAYRQSRNSEWQVDKSGLLAYTNKVLFTPYKYVCDSRPSGFGKTVTAHMLCAYYSKGCSSRELFAENKIAEEESFHRHLNQYNLLYLPMKDLLGQGTGRASKISLEEALARMERQVLWELLGLYPHIRYFDPADLGRTMRDLSAGTGEPFIVVIDDWDVVMGERREEREIYAQYLARLLIEKEYIHLVYMCGKMPPDAWGAQELGAFAAFSMRNPSHLAEYIGFTQKEVRRICDASGRDEQELREWCGGYLWRDGATQHPGFCPKAVSDLVMYGTEGGRRTENNEVMLKGRLAAESGKVQECLAALLAGSRMKEGAGNPGKYALVPDGRGDGGQDRAACLFAWMVQSGLLAYDSGERQLWIPNRASRAILRMAVRTIGGVGNGGAFPDREEAMKILEDGEKCNPGPWKEHSIVTARCAEKIALACGDMDGEKAYVLGLLHDIGRRMGKGHMRHIIDGYFYMKELGYPEAARICVTHSFSIQSIQDYIGRFDVSAEELELIKALLDSYTYDDYDRLIQLCDSVALPEGIVDMDIRMDSVAVRYGYYPPEKRRKNYEIKKYFEEKMGRGLYEVIGRE